MSDSLSTVILENERADRFGKARSRSYVAWTREQGDKLRDIQNEQTPITEEQAAVQANVGSVETKFNTH